MASIPVSRVLRGLAEVLTVAGVATYRDVGASEVGLKVLPSQGDRAVAINVYDISDGLVLPDVEVMVQFRFRAKGANTAVDDFADALFPVLHGARMLPAGELVIQQARRISVAPLGQDANQRFERADNYSLIFKRA